jgi:hypothetical protein
MSENVISARLGLTVIVAAHLVISTVHGAAHNRAQVPLSAAATLFVFVVILAGPIVGVLVMWRAERLGASIIAISMAGSFIFGVLNHFVLASPDHVAHVVRTWQPLFATTAVLLAATEALASVVAFRVAQRTQTMS